MQNDDYRNDRDGRRDSTRYDRDEDLRASRGYGRGDRDRPGMVSDRDWAGPSQYARGGDYGNGGYDQSRSYRRDNDDLYRGSASMYGDRDYGQDMGRGGPTSRSYGDRMGAGQSYGGQNYGGQSYGGQSYGGQSYGGRSQGAGDWDRTMSEGMGAGRMGMAASAANMGSGRGSDWGRSGYDDDMSRGGMSGSQSYDYGMGGRQGGGMGMGSMGRGMAGGSYGSSGYSQNDAYTTGSSHRGRGPKGYARSDDRVREDVSDRLADDHMIDASDIEVQVSGGEVTLTGQVDSREAKRRAEDCAESVSGVNHVQNNLRVRKDGMAGGMAGHQGSTGGMSGSSSTGSSGSSMAGSPSTGASSTGTSSMGGSSMGASTSGTSASGMAGSTAGSATTGSTTRS